MRSPGLQATHALCCTPSRAAPASFNDRRRPDLTSLSCQRCHSSLAADGEGPDQIHHQLAYTALSNTKNAPLPPPFIACRRRGATGEKGGGGRRGWRVEPRRRLPWQPLGLFRGSQLRQQHGGESWGRGTRASVWNLPNLYLK
jgi:hypothetical protein